jgi:two-component system phosphate regulon sensor histidine kinase PhoR
MPRQGARPSLNLSLMLAVVFPTIISAAVALAYYGYRYAVAASGRSKASLMEGNEQVAQLLISQVQNRIDELDRELFAAFEWRGAPEEPPAFFELPAGVESVALLDEALKIRSVYPPPPPPADPRRRPRELDRWQSYVKGLDWRSLERWTPDLPGNFRHLHQLFEGKSVLIAYAAKTTVDAQSYYLAAKLDLKVLTKEWIPRRSRRWRASAASRSSTRSRGPSMASRRGRRPFLYEASFGKTLYAWRVQIAPKNVAELRAQAEQERLLGVLLIPVSTGHHRRRAWASCGSPCAPSAAPRSSRATSSPTCRTSSRRRSRYPHVRRAHRHGEAQGRGLGARVRGIITRESERLAHLIDNVLDFARLERGKASYSSRKVIWRGGGARAGRVPPPPGEGEAALRTEIESNLPPCAWTRAR